MERTIKTLLFLSMSVTWIVTFTVVFILAEQSYFFFEKVSLVEFLFGTRWEPLIEPKSFGVLPLVMGTLLIVVGSMVVALPLGILVSTYLNEYAHPKTRTWVKPFLEILAGIPTVVYGFFALSFITPLLRLIFPQIEIFNALSGAMVVGVMILPMVASLCDDAFLALPKELKQGAYALGANTFEVVLQVTIPAIRSRIGAIMVLSISRAVGETMAVTLAAGATPKMTLNPFESIQTMTAYIVQISLGDAPAGGIESLTCYAVGGLLFLITLALNITGHLLLKNKNQVVGV